MAYSLTAASGGKQALAIITKSSSAGGTSISRFAILRPIESASAWDINISVAHSLASDDPLTSCIREFGRENPNLNIIEAVFEMSNMAEVRSTRADTIRLLLKRSP